MKPQKKYKTYTDPKVELKTLNDLIAKRNREMKRAGLKLSHPEEMSISPRVLKAEAVKHGNDKFTEHMSARAWIVWFFNITEENLK